MKSLIAIILVTYFGVVVQAAVDVGVDPQAEIVSDGANFVAVGAPGYCPMCKNKAMLSNNVRVLNAAGTPGDIPDFSGSGQGVQRRK